MPTPIGRFANGKFGGFGSCGTSLPGTTGFVVTRDIGNDAPVAADVFVLIN